jgi:hypothetical protein
MGLYLKARPQTNEIEPMLPLIVANETCLLHLVKSELAEVRLFHLCSKSINVAKFPLRVVETKNLAKEEYNFLAESYTDKFLESRKNGQPVSPPKGHFSYSCRWQCSVVVHFPSHFNPGYINFIIEFMQVFHQQAIILNIKIQNS